MPEAVDVDVDVVQLEDRTGGNFGGKQERLTSVSNKTSKDDGRGLDVDKASDSEAFFRGGGSRSGAKQGQV